MNQIKVPEGIKKELIINLHKFMMSLSQAYHSDQKEIVLYIPKENLSDLDQVIKDKDLISRLETIMVEWTNQIRDFINGQETVTNREDYNVIDEIKFWELRNMNLSNISRQLEIGDLKRIIEVLDKVRAQSDNLSGFKKLKDNIFSEKKKAQNILNNIKILYDLSFSIMKADIREIPSILQKIIDRIRCITEKCESYKNREKCTDLIKKVSIQLMHRFISKIKENLVNIKQEYSEDLHHDIKLIKICIWEWKTIYYKSKKRVASFKKDDRQLQEIWDFQTKDYQNIFYDLESFEKRCLNLEDICLCQLQFGKNKNAKNPIWGGTKRYEITKQLKDIEDKFDDQMKRLFSADIKVEDIKVNKWQEEFRNFSKSIEDLEDIYKNSISSAFKRVNTIEEAVNYVENFYSLAKRQKIKDYIKNEIANDILGIWSKDIEKMKIVINNLIFYFKILKLIYFYLFNF